MKAIEVKVLDNDLEKAMRVLKKKIQNDGLFKRLKLKKSYEKPSEYRRRKQREALRNSPGQKKILDHLQKHDSK